MDRLTATPPNITLGPLTLIADNHARSFVIELRAGRFHGFIVRQGEAVHGYVDRCPHMGLPLAQELDEYVAPGGEYLMCSWHGASFRIEDGYCVGGPCSDASLQPWPITVRDGMLVTT